MTICNICPRNCGIERKEKAGAVGNVGICKMPREPRIARAGLHFWEEPCISGVRGSGTVFFSGCNLHCVFCQNYKISTENQGRAVSVEKLRAIYAKLIAQGAHNINLVTPTHYMEAILQSLATPLSVPVVYNTGSYEKVEMLRLLEGKIQVYLPDVKYYSPESAERYSKAADYFKVATAAIEEMYRQVGPYKLDENGMLLSGVIIRHLILPGQIEDTKRIIAWVEDRFEPGQVMFSLMHQYIPYGAAEKYPEINRKITEEEYNEAEDYLLAGSIEDGFIQEEEAADEKFIPAFDEDFL